MTLTKLKPKNQLTIPNEIVKKLHLRENELFIVDIEQNYIRLVPVEIEPRYTTEELNAIDKIVEREKSKAKIIRSGKSFTNYIKTIKTATK